MIADYPLIPDEAFLYFPQGNLDVIQKTKWSKIEMEPSRESFLEEVSPSEMNR